MKLYLDTANDDFSLAIFDNNFKKIDSSIYENYQKKVNLTVQEIEKILNKNQIDISEINEYYLNIGPGSFTGSRVGLVYLRTIAEIQKKPIFTISTMQLLQKQNPNVETFHISAAGNKFYEYKRSDNFDENKINLVLNEKNDCLCLKVKHDLFFNNFVDYLPLFKKYNYNELINIKPLYVKMPQIGNKK